MRFNPSRTRAFRLLPAAVLCASPLAGGCQTAPGDGEVGERAPVSGQVFYRGAPLPAGGVRFICADGSRSAFTMIGAGGVYVLPNAPVGRVKVCVDTSILRRFSLDPITVPEKYKSFRDTDLTYEVVPGPQSFDIHVP